MPYKLLIADDERDITDMLEFAFDDGNKDLFLRFYYKLDLKLKKANQEKLAKEQLDAARAFAGELETKEVTVYIKTGEGGRTFGSISSKEIAEAAKAQCGVEIDKKKIQMPEAIKSLGVYEVSVKLHPQVTGKLKVKVQETES